MIETIEVRLVKVTEDKPKGMIVGWFKIDKGNLFYNKFPTEKEWRPLFIVGGVPDFTHIEHKAPFKAKDGGELYEGDIVSQDICMGVLIFGMGGNGFDGWWMQDEDTLKVNHVRPAENSPITKLGNIHEEENKNG